MCYYFDFFKKLLCAVFTICLLTTCEKQEAEDQTEEPVVVDGSTKVTALNMPVDVFMDDFFINAIAFDNNGIAWFGTFRQGILKCVKKSSNAIEVTSFQHSDIPAIPDEMTVYDIAVDSKNNIWFGSDKGLLKYDGTNFTLYNSKNSPMPRDFVSAMVVDSKDNLWFSSSIFKEGGLVRLSGSKWTVFTPDNSDLPVNLIQDITVDKNDHVWLVLSETITNGYLVEISDNRWTTYTEKNFGLNLFYFGNIDFTSTNKLCVAFDYSFAVYGRTEMPMGFIYDGKTTELINFDKTSDPYFLTVDKNDNIWLASNKLTSNPMSLAIFDGSEWKVDYTTFPMINAMKQSEDNAMWIGTSRGLYIVNP